MRTVKLDSTVRTLQQLRPEYTIIMISFLDFENHENCAYSRYLNFPNFRYLNFDINDLAFNLQAAAQLALPTLLGGVLLQEALHLPRGTRGR